MLAILSFVMVLAAAVLTVDSMFLLSFAGFMLMAVVTFVLMEMRHSSGSASIHATESGDRQAYRHMAFALAGASPLLMMLIVLGASLIFFLLPRVSSRYLSAFAPTRALTTRFRGRVRLGQTRQIQQSNSVVLHLQVD